MMDLMVYSSNVRCLLTISVSDTFFSNVALLQYSTLGEVYMTNIKFNGKLLFEKGNAFMDLIKS